MDKEETTLKLVKESIRTHTYDKAHNTEFIPKAATRKGRTTQKVEIWTINNQSKPCHFCGM